METVPHTHTHTHTHTHARTHAHTDKRTHSARPLCLLVFLCVPIMNTCSCDSRKTYKTLANLKRHLDDTHSDKLFQWETCDKQFTAKRNLLSHHKRRHQQSDTTYLCPHCGRKYLAESSMYSHVRYKHKQAEQLCKFCNKRFKDNNALDRHMKKHDNKKDVCPRCCGLFKDVKQHV